MLEAWETTRFVDCHFNEAISPPLGGEKKNHEKDVSWSEPLLFYLDPHTKQSETEVQKIMHMQKIVNQLPDAFTDTKRVIKSYIPDDNAPARVEIPYVKSNDKVTQESKACLKHGRPVDLIDEKFRYNVVCDIMNGNDDPETTPVIKCQSTHDWNKWKESMQYELSSHNKRKVFGRIVLTPGVVKPVGYRWVFIRKRNENDEFIRYKARFIAQVYENLDMRLMDVVIAYLYGSLDSDIYMKIPEGFKMPEA
nr:hypothetical protein [Tanacetum cinerariifolium]